MSETFSLDNSSISKLKKETEGNHPKPTEFLQLSEQDYLILDWIEVYAQENPWAFDFMLEIIEKYHLGDIEWKERQDNLTKGEKI